MRCANEAYNAKRSSKLKLKSEKATEQAKKNNCALPQAREAAVKARGRESERESAPRNELVSESNCRAHLSASEWEVRVRVECAGRVECGERVDYV